jgi:2'-5' RNA ligase
MRLFVGIALPDSVGAALWGLAGGLDGADWVDPGSYHITLRFIGEVGRADAEEIDAALAELVAPRFALSLAGIDIFQTAGRPRTLWARVEKAPPLLHLVRKVERAIVQAGRPPEDRSFTPHVTLARLRDASMPAVMRFIADHALFRSGSFPVDHFTLFESRQGGGGPAYHRLADYDLAAAGMTRAGGDSILSSPADR